MPVFAYLGVVGLALLALLFVADTTLEKGAPPIVTSSRVGLPERWHPDTIQVLTTTPAPVPDMTSQAVLAAQPKVEAQALAKIAPAARAARAEVPVENNHIAQANDHVMHPIDRRMNSSGDRFSISGQ